MMRRRVDISELEIMLAATQFGWAVLLMTPAVVFRSSAYGPMQRVAPEWCWGLLALAVCAVVVAGAVSFNERIQIIGLALMAAWWGWISGMFVVSDGIPTGIVVYGIMAGSALWRVFARISGHAPLIYITRDDDDEGWTHS